MLAAYPLNFHALNVDVNRTRSLGSFTFDVSCDPSSDPVGGDVVLDGFTWTGTKRDKLIKAGLYFSAPMNFTIRNSHIGSYGDAVSGKIPLVINSPQACLPSDDTLQFVEIIDTTVE